MACGRMIGPFECCSVVCCDCLEAMKQLPDGCVDAVVTDPPYGINLGSHRGIKRNFDWKVLGDRDQESGARALMFLERTPTITFANPKKPWPGQWNQHLVWWKGPAVGGGGDTATYWKMDWELLQVRNLGRLLGPRDSSVISEWVVPQDAEHHPCQKPEELMIYLVGKVDAETILDPFCGSGTTLVAAKKLGRHYLGFEIDHTYAQISRDRLARVEAQPSLFEQKPEQLGLIPEAAKQPSTSYAQHRDIVGKLPADLTVHEPIANLQSSEQGGHDEPR